MDGQAAGRRSRQPAMRGVAPNAQEMPADDGAAATGLRALWVLAQNDANKAAIAVAGGIDAVLVAVREHRADCGVAEPGLRALANLAVNDANEDPFFMSQNAFLRFCHEAKLFDDYGFTHEVACRIFVQVNVEIAGTVDKETAKVNDDNSLMRHEMIEALLRIADAKFGMQEKFGAIVKAGGSISVKMLQGPLDQLRLEHFSQLHADAIGDGDAYRTARLYAVEVDNALVRHQRVLKAVWSAASSPSNGSESFEPGGKRTGSSAAAITSSRGWSPATNRRPAASWVRPRLTMGTKASCSRRKTHVASQGTRSVTASSRRP